MWPWMKFTKEGCFLGFWASGTLGSSEQRASIKHPPKDSRDLGINVGEANEVEA